jgi:PST family polysaccharide transporter
MTQAPPSMMSRTLSGLFWMSLATGANAVVLLLVVVVLARLLTPADFGLAAAALMVVGFSAIFSELGIGPAVVQRPDLQTAHLRAGFTVSILLGVLLAVLTWVSAPVVAAFFRLDGLTPLLRALAFVFPLQGLAVVADSLLQREFRFRCLGILEMVSLVLGYGVVGVILAALDYAAWALVGAHLAQTVVRTGLLLVLRPHPAWPLLERRACTDLLYFGGGYTAGRLSNYLAGQGEHLVIGRWLGAAALGVYGRAYQLMAAPAVLFGNVLDRVLFPAMAHVQDDPKSLAAAYRRASSLIALVILPTSAVLVALAPEVVRVLLGPEWPAVVLPLQILCVGMLFRTGCKVSDSLARATGAVYSRTWRQTTYAALVLAGAWVGQWAGVEGVAFAVLVTLAVNFFLMAQLSLCLAALSWRSFGAAHLPGLALAALVGAPVALTAAVARARDLSPVVVIAAALAAILPCLVLVRGWPGFFLGPDGRWMARKVRALVFGATARPAPASGWAVGATNGPAMPRIPDDGLLGQLVHRLAACGVRYCRCKGRVDVRRVLSGEGDLDLLVDHTHAQIFVGLAEQLGFKRVVSCFEPEQSRELHLYGPDLDTGVWVHLHVSVALPGSTAKTGDVAASLDELVLRHAVPVDVPGLPPGLPVVDPRAELIVSVVQTMQRYASLHQHLRRALRGKVLRAKLQAVLAQAEAAGWRDMLEVWLPAVPPALFGECVQALRQPTSWLRRLLLARRLRACLGAGRPSGAGAGRRLLAVVRAGSWRLFHGLGSPKQLPSGGAVLAFVGPEACGKSTLVAETSTWLGKVFRVKSAHLGKPPPTWLTLVPSVAWALLRHMAPRLRAGHRPADEPRSAGGSWGLLARLKAVALAWDRRALATRLARQAARGWLVVCDRYPSAVVGAADSARLTVNEALIGKGRLGARLARLEQRLYLGVPAPDLVIRLTAPLAVALRRNQARQKAGKESDPYVTRRHKEFVAPPFAGVPIVELDTDEPPAVTVRTLRGLLWERLGKTAAGRAVPRGRAGHIESVGGGPLLVEFIGVTGVGKTTLVAAVAEFLAEQGLHVREAEAAILARYEPAFARRPKVRAALLHLLALPPFWGHCLTREGRRLWRLAVGSIVRGAGGLRIGTGLLRNYWKRIGSHFLLERLRGGLPGCDVILCDEGAVQAAHNLFVHTGSEPRREAIVRFARMVPKPDLLIWVTAPTAQSTSVILRRGHPRVEGTPQAAQAFAERAHATFEVLASVDGVREITFRADNDRAGDAGGAAVRSRAATIGAFVIQQCQGRRRAHPARNGRAP